MIEEMKELVARKAYKEFREYAMEENEADIASVLEEMPEGELLTFFRILPKDKAADVFAYLPIDVQQHMIVTLHSARLPASLRTFRSMMRPTSWTRCRPTLLRDFSPTQVRRQEARSTRFSNTPTVPPEA